MASPLPTTTNDKQHELRPTQNEHTTSKRFHLLKKALTVGVGATFATTMALGLYGAHSETFQHDNGRILAELSDASSIHVTFTPKSDAFSGMDVVDGYLFPKKNADGTLAFDGRISYVYVGNQFNFTVLDNRGYVTVEDQSTGKLLRNECLVSGDVPPIATFTDALLDARVIDSVSSFNVSCDSESKLVEFVFAGEPYVFCSSASSALDSIHGEDLQATVELLNDALPSLDSLNPSGLDINTCELLVGEESTSTATSSTTTSRRLMNKAIQRTKDAVQVIRGEPRRSLADESDCSCSGGKKKCLFVHGLGYADGNMTDSFADYFGTIESQATCCTSVKFLHIDTTNTAWYDDALSNKVCEGALQVSGSKDKMNIENLALVAHSMGNMVISSALMKGTCALGASSKWISLNGPIYGSASASTAVSLFSSLPTSWQTSLCTQDGGVIDDAFFNALSHYGLCPTAISIRSIAAGNSSVATADLNALYLKSGQTFASHVSSNLCGVSFSGLLSSDTAALTVMGLLSGHASLQNDGQVDFSSCRATLSESKYSTSWNGGNFYKASINHLDGTFRHGDGLWGDARKPIKWFNCQF